MNDLPESLVIVAIIVAASVAFSTMVRSCDADRRRADWNDCLAKHGAQCGVMP